MFSKPLLCLFVVFCVLATACGQSSVVVCEQVSLGQSAKHHWGVEQWPESWPDRSTSCSFGNYTVLTAAAGSEVDHVMLFRNGEPVFVRQGDVDAIFEGGRPAVTATDADRNGLFEHVSYSVYSDDIWDEIAVVDRDRDGQPDLRSYYRKGKREHWLWVDDGWYKTPKLGSMVVLVDGIPRAYEAVSGRFIFVNSQ